MKSFKKVLCLVLVVVMALGVSTVAFAGNLDKFTDADKAVAPYAEAVDVLVGLKVVNGVTTTELALDQSYTREQAAKVIAYLVLGQRAADALSADSAPFADVEASRWSAGYIAFCVRQGIIAGYDATTFGPADSLTGYQFAKMLLTAVGYGKNKEYVGEGWSINVAKDALALGIFEDDVSAATNAAISRKQAMLMAFNTLVNVPTVNYNANFQVYYTGNSFMDGIEKVDAYNKDDDGYVFTLGWTVFGLQAREGEMSGGQNPVFTPNTDGYGRVIRTWTTNNDRTIVSGDHATVPDHTFTGKVTQKALYEALGKTVATTYTRTTYVDGVETETVPALGKSSTDAYSDTGASTTTEVYVNDDTVTVVIINNFFAKVATVNEDDEYVTFTVYDSTNRTSEQFETTAFEKNDFVVVNMYKEGTGENAKWYVTKAYAAEEVEDTEVTAVSDGKYVKAGSTTYNMAAQLRYNVANDAFVAGSSYNLYLDSFGNLIGAELYSESATSANYLYVNESDAGKYGAISGAAYVKVAADFTDGTSKVVSLNVKDATKSSAYINLGGNNITVTDSTALVDSGFYSYTVNSDGLYTLKSIDYISNAKDAIGNEMSFAKGKADITIAGSPDTIIKATSTSKLVLVDDQVTYTGFTKFPISTDVISNETGKESNILYILKDNKIATIYVFGNKGAKTEVTFARVKEFVEKDTKYFYYNLFVDGKLTEYKFESELTAGDMGSIKVNSSGVAEFTKYTDATEYNVKSGVVNTVDPGYIIFADNAMFYLGDDDTDCEVYDIKSAITSGDLADGDTVNIIYKGTVAYVVFIVKAS